MGKKKVIILQGVPGSGKSTLAREMVSNKPDWVRINRDDLRNMRGIYWVPNQEGLITKWEHSCLRVALGVGFNIVFDSTNLNPKTLEKVEKIISEFPEYEIEFKLLDTPLDVCIDRDSKRENPVGKMVITNFYNKYIKDEE